MEVSWAGGIILGKFKDNITESGASLGPDTTVLMVTMTRTRTTCRSSRNESEIGTYDVPNRLSLYCEDYLKLMRSWR